MCYCAGHCHFVCDVSSAQKIVNLLPLTLLHEHAHAHRRVSQEHAPTKESIFFHINNIPMTEKKNPE